MKDNYILDSSIWIEMERGNPSLLSEVQPLIARNEVCLVDAIVAEVLRGTKTKKDFMRLQEAFSNFVQLSTRWERVAELAFEVGRKGLYPPLIDLYIAQCAVENVKTLITQDKHFPQIAKIRPFAVRHFSPG